MCYHSKALATERRPDFVIVRDHLGNQGAEEDADEEDSGKKPASTTRRRSDTVPTSDSEEVKEDVKPTMKSLGLTKKEQRREFRRLLAPIWHKYLGTLTWININMGAYACAASGGIPTKAAASDFVFTRLGNEVRRAGARWIGAPRLGPLPIDTTGNRGIDSIPDSTKKVLADFLETNPQMNVQWVRDDGDDEDYLLSLGPDYPRVVITTTPDEDGNIGIMFSDDSYAGPIRTTMKGFKKYYGDVNDKVLARELKLRGFTGTFVAVEDMPYMPSRVRALLPKGSPLLAKSAIDAMLVDNGAEDNFGLDAMEGVEGGAQEDAGSLGDNDDDDEEEDDSKSGSKTNVTDQADSGAEGDGDGEDEQEDDEDDEEEEEEEEPKRASHVHHTRSSKRRLPSTDDEPDVEPPKKVSRTSGETSVDAKAKNRQASGSPKTSTVRKTSGSRKTSTSKRVKSSALIDDDDDNDVEQELGTATGGDPDKSHRRAKSPVVAPDSALAAPTTSSGATQDAPTTSTSSNKPLGLRVLAKRPDSKLLPPEKLASKPLSTPSAPDETTKAEHPVLSDDDLNLDDKAKKTNVGPCTLDDNLPDVESHLGDSPPKKRTGRSSGQRTTSAQEKQKQEEEKEKERQRETEKEKEQEVEVEVEQEVEDEDASQPQAIAAPLHVVDFDTSGLEELDEDGLTSIIEYLDLELPPPPEPGDPIYIPEPCRTYEYRTALTRSIAAYREGNKLERGDGKLMRVLRDAYPSDMCIPSIILLLVMFPPKHPRFPVYKTWRHAEVERVERLKAKAQLPN